MLSAACTRSGSIGQSDHCCSLPSCGQCSGADPCRTESRSAERVTSEVARLLYAPSAPYSPSPGRRLSGSVLTVAAPDDHDYKGSLLGGLDGGYNRRML